MFGLARLKELEGENASLKRDLARCKKQCSDKDREIEKSSVELRRMKERLVREIPRVEVVRCPSLTRFLLDGAQDSVRAEDGRGNSFEMDTVDSFLASENTLYCKGRDGRWVAFVVNYRDVGTFPKWMLPDIRCVEGRPGMKANVPAIEKTEIDTAAGVAAFADALFGGDGPAKESL